MTTRIYVINERIDNDTVTQSLVEAATPAAAIRHCAVARFSAYAAKSGDVALLMGNGVKVEKAGE